MRVQSMPARSANSCALIRITPATRDYLAADIEPLPVHHKAAAIPDDNLHLIQRFARKTTASTLHRVMAQRPLRQERQTIRTLLKSTGCVATATIRPAAASVRTHPPERQKHITNTARPGVPAYSTRAPRNSTVTVDVSGDTEVPQSPVAPIPTPKARTIRYPASCNPCLSLNADAATAYLLGPAPMAAGDICDNRARLEAFRGNLCLQIVEPKADLRRQLPLRYVNGRLVVRMVVHCEHPCRK